MGLKQFPNFSRGGGGGGLSFPLSAPAGSAQSISYGFANGGGLYGSSDGALNFATANQPNAFALDASGKATFTQPLTAQALASLQGGIATTTVDAATITTTGNTSVGGSLGVAGSLQVTSDLSAGKITASSDLTAASLNTSGAISGATLTVTGKATLGSIDVQGTFKANQIESDGALYFPQTSTNAPGLALGSETGTGLFAAQGGTIGLSSQGQVVVNFASNLAATFAGAVTTQALTAQATQLQSLAVSGASQLEGLEAQTLTVDGATQLQGDLNVAGTSRLANLDISALSTNGDLNVGGNASIVGSTVAQSNLTVQGATQLGNLAAGASALGQTTSPRVDVGQLRVPGEGGGNPPVLKEPIPNQPGTNDFVVVLDGNGNLAISATLYVGSTTHLHSALTCDAPITSTALTTGAIQGSSATLSGALAAQGSLSGSALTLGGVQYQVYAGNPEGNVVGNLGDQVVDSANGVLFIKLAGAGTTNGWTKVATSASSLTYPLQAPNTQASDGPSFSFAGSSGDGLGSEVAGEVYLSAGGQAVLTVTNAQEATFSGPVEAVEVDAGRGNFTGDLTAGGALKGNTLTTAGQSNLGPLIAGASTLDSLTVNNNASIGGTAQVAGNASFGGQLSATGAVQSQASVAAPLLKVGTQQLQSGSGQPTGNVVGSVGDVYADQQGGGLWIKASGTDSNGWVQVATSQSGVTFPLVAPAGTAQAASYGFQGGQGFTLIGGELSAVVGGQAAWQVGSDLGFALAGALSVATNAAISGTLSVGGNSTLAGVSVAQLSASGGIAGGSLAISGNAQLGATTTAALSAGQLTGSAGATFTGGGSFGGALSVGAALTAAGALSGSQVVSGGVTWSAGSQAPASGSGNPADLASITDSSSTHPLLVRVGSTWKQVSLVGDPEPSQFPLQGPADSASAPNFAPSAASAGSGMYSPGSNQLAFSTNGVQAALADASQNWTFAAAISAGAGTFTALTDSGTLSVTGATSLGNTLQVNGAVTLASTLNSGAITSSGQVNAASLVAAGAISGQTLATSGDASVGGNLAVSGTITYNGVQKIGAIQLGDGSVSSCALAFQSEPGLGIYRVGSGTLAFAAAGAQTLQLAASLATFPGGINVGGANAGLTSPGSNRLALQTAGTTALSVDAGQNLTAAAKLTVTGITTGPTANWTQSVTSPLVALGEGSAPQSAATGQLFVKSADHNLYFLSSQGTTTQLTPYSPSYPAVGPAGSASAPTFAVGSAGTGIYSGTDAQSHAFLGLTNAGTAVGRFTSFTANSLPVYVLGLGDPTNSSTSGAFVASAQAPSTGAPNALPGAFYAFLGGGPAATGWINESKTSTPAFAKILTTSSPVAPTFPLVAPADSAGAPSYTWTGSTSTGFYLAGTNSLGFTTNGTTAATVSSAQAWTFNGAVTASTTLTVTGAATLSAALSVGGAATLSGTLNVANAATLSGTLNVAGATTLQAALSGAAAAFSGNVTVGGTLAVTGGTSGTTSAWSTSVGSPLYAFSETTTPSTASTGQLFVKSSDHNLYFLSSAGVTTQVTPYAPQWPLLAPADSVTAPDYSWSGNAGTGMYLAGTNSIGFTTNGVKAATVSSAQAWAFAGAVTAATTLGVTGNTTLGGTLNVSGATTCQALTGTTGFFSGLTTASGGINCTNGTVTAPGLYFSGVTGTGFCGASDSNSTPALSATVNGTPIAWFTTYVSGGSNKRVYGIFIGNPKGLPSIGGLMASAASPVSTVGGDPGNIYVYPGGGAGNTGFIYEGTSSGTSGWAKILTTGSTIAPTYPLASTTLGSASTPAYGFGGVSGYASTGIFAAAEQSTGNPAVALASNGIAVGYFLGQTLNSLPVGSLFFGNPTTAPTSSTLSGSLRSSPQTPVGNIGGYQGQLYLNTAGGIGTSAWVKESYNSSNASAGWASLFTSGMPQLVSQAGSVSAPYYSFPNKTSGLFFDGTFTGFAHGGQEVLAVGGGFGGTAASAGYNGLTFGAPNTAGIPYIFGIPSGTANAGNPVTNQVLANQAAVMLNAAGAAGDQIWVHESSTNTTYSAWVRVITESTLQNSITLKQVAAPTYVSGTNKLWADTNGLVRTGVYGVNATQAPTLKQEIPATVYTNNQTLLIANNNTTICLTSSTQYTLTLPSSSSTIDLCYRFQVENAAGVVIQANTGQIIYFAGSSPSSSGGTITSTTLGGTVELFCRAGTNNWFARGAMGTWSTA